MTVVYPLPAAGQEDDLVKPTAAGTNGVLLPRDVFEGGRMPELVPARACGALRSVSAELLGEPTEERENFRPVVRALNPRIHSSETMDSAGCHIAPDVAVFLGERMPLTSFEERFQSRYSLEAAHKSQDEAVAFEHMHMLSYSGASLSIGLPTRPLPCSSY
ncbi:hypothetical protein LVJ94_02380 [Pendulispora rubella]|uniref:Uncharacterized protein n=1 Tax=Pendulispora rubella TaxID=2741070 RepID=A0ABZ2L5Q5_9BACT